MHKTNPNKFVVVIQARSSSTRLPGKVFLPLAGKPLLVRMVERVLMAKLPSVVVVATSTEPDDDAIVQLCNKHSIEVIRGSLNDLLERHYVAGKHYNAEYVVKIPSDCPLIDPTIIDKVLQYTLDNKDSFDFVSNLHPATYPDGNDVEVMPMNMVELAVLEATKQLEREHTTPFFWDNPTRFRIGSVVWEKGLDYSLSHRFTIDYKEDYDFINQVYNHLYEQNPMFSLDDILQLLEEHPEIYEINSRYCGVNWYRNHLDELQTVDATKTKQL
jgi:spore coat polysaccharide biosynthesis protein SpsF